MINEYMLLKWLNKNQKSFLFFKIFIGQKIILLFKNDWAQTITSIESVKNISLPLERGESSNCLKNNENKI